MSRSKAWWDRGSDVAALALSAGAAVAFLVLALAPEQGAVARGRAALAEATDSWSRRIAAEPQEELLRELLQAGPLESYSIAPRTPFASPRAPSQGPEHQIFEALFAEASRVELALGDLPAALRLVAEARSRTSDPIRQALCNLRELQLQRKLHVPEPARAMASVLASSLDPAWALEEVPLLLRAAMAARGLEAPELENALLGALDSRSLGLGEPISEQANSWMLLAAESAAVAQRWQAWREQNSAERLRASLEAWPAKWEDSVGHVLAGQQVLVYRRLAPERIEGRLIDETAWREAWRVRLSRLGALEAGFDVSPSAGQRAGDPIRVAQWPWALQLVHVEPERFAKEAAPRALAARSAWCLAALVALLAGFASARAIRRERTLANLRSEFVANVSHELRTPVSSLLLMSENLQHGRVKSPEERERYYSLMQREARRLARLVDDVLDVARMERGRPSSHQPEDTAIAPCFDALAREANEYAQAHHLELSTRCEALDGQHADIDREALRRALLNLLDNARKHGGGRIELSASAQGAHWTIVVRDHGPGLNAGEHARAFEAYWRSPRAQAAGAGLGLSIVRAIVERHGGSVQLHSPSTGSGLEVRLQLPLTEASE